MWDVQFQDAQEKAGAKEQVGHRTSGNTVRGKSMEKNVLINHGRQMSNVTRRQKLFLKRVNSNVKLSYEIK